MSASASPPAIAAPRSLDLLLAIAWAPPEPVTLTVHTDRSRLLLSVRAAGRETLAPPFADAAGAPPFAQEEIEAPGSSRRVVRRHAMSESTCRYFVISKYRHAIRHG